jgi:RNA-directed DNA polymerase
VRYADDSNIYVKSQRAGERVLCNISRFLSNRLRLQVNQEKSAVDRPWKRTFLGFTFTRSGRRPSRIKVSERSILALKHKVRRITSRTRGISVMRVISDLSCYLRGWKNYFSLAEARSILRDLDKWILRRLRCIHLKQWGRSGYRELSKRGVSVRLAWNTAKSAHGPWRLSHSPALSIALPLRYFVSLGLISLYTRKQD